MQDTRIVDRINDKNIYFDGINYYILTKDNRALVIDYINYKNGNK